MALGTGSSVSALTRTLSSAGRIAGSASRRTGRRIRRAAIAAPLGTGGFLGASVAGWISTSPSLLPRTWWMWTVNIGFSQIYGYATGTLADRLIRRRSEEHTSELQSRGHLVCRLLLEKRTAATQSTQHNVALPSLA